MPYTVPNFRLFSTASAAADYLAGYLADFRGIVMPSVLLELRFEQLILLLVSFKAGEVRGFL